MTVAILPGTAKSVVSLLDVTERKRAEDALRRMNADLENVFENSPDAIGIVKERGEDDPAVWLQAFINAS